VIAPDAGVNVTVPAPKFKIVQAKGNVITGAAVKLTATGDASDRMMNALASDWVVEYATLPDWLLTVPYALTICWIIVSLAVLLLVTVFVTEATALLLASI
jgi:hypothetical protein